VFDPNQNLVAVVDVSSYEPELSEHSHALAFALTVEAARSIEERLFRHVYRRAWILAAIAPTRSQPILLAVDDERVVGADRHARAALDIDDQQLAAGLSCGAFSIVHRRSLLRKAATPSPSSRGSGNRRLGMWSSLHRCHRAPLARLASSHAALLRIFGSRAAAPP
jgi:transcriptional regulator of acetoin/glycerol metabolism